MNLDENIQKTLNLLLKKWKFLVCFAVAGVLVACAITYQFTTLTYTSSIEFLAYAYDSEQEFMDSSSTTQSQNAVDQQASETSKMNYAMKMLDTYIHLFSTNQFNQDIADELNKTYGTDYSASFIANSVVIQKVENTAIFSFTVTTTDADLSYHIARSIEKCVPEKMSETNSGLVLASVQDPPVKAPLAESKGYPKKALIGAVAGLVLAALIVIFKDLIDIRIKGSEDLQDKYDIPVLGTVPEFTLTPQKTKAGDKNNG